MTSDAKWGLLAGVAGVVAVAVVYFPAPPPSQVSAAPAALAPGEAPAVPPAAGLAPPPREALPVSWRR